ncbi:MAG: hypothetical protein WBX25_00760 [Rhodomicrobium sp.]
MSLVSLLFAPKLQIQDRRWSGSFNLVVGDNFADRVLFWNARLLIPDWLDSDLCCFRVTLNDLSDPSMLSVLGELLKHRNHVNAGSGGQSQVTIRSASLSKEELEKVRELVMSAKPWGAVRTEVISGLADLVPTNKALDEAKENNSFWGELFPRPEWTEFAWTAPRARPPATKPDHLSDAPTRQTFTEGYWCTDLIFEYDGPGSRFREENRWMLPRRWRIAGAFKATFVGKRDYGVPTPRRSRDGNLAVFVNSIHPLETMEIPAAYEALVHGFAVDGAWAEQQAEHGRIYPPNKVAWAQPSNEARYLTGVLGMTGGLPRATVFLLHPFLRENFAKMGGTPNLSVDDIASTLNRLQKRSKRQLAFDLRNAGERNALANLIVKAARTLKKPLDFISYEDVKKSWKEYREQYRAAHPLQGEKSASDDWERQEEASLDACLIELRRRQMIFQGHRWICPKCHHRNWVDLAVLSSELLCAVCKHCQQAPVDIRWLFRPNEFLIESLRDHSVLSLIWVLSAFRARSRKSLIFVEPMWLGFSTTSDCPDAEADMLAILDGKAVVCEAKSSWRSLRSSDIAEFVELASRLRPDIALLAVMESGRRFEAELASAASELAVQNIQFELLTADKYIPRDDPFIHFDREG